MSASVSALVFARDLRDPTDTRQRHAIAVTRDREVRVARGAYIDRDLWEGLEPTARYLLRVRAVAETRRNRPVMSHWSAAAVHGLPIVGAWPTAVHITQSAPQVTRSRNGVVRHSLRLDDEDLLETEGMLVTSLPRTLVDLAGGLRPAP